MKKLLILTGLLAAAIFGTASSASAASACYSAQVTVNGGSVINEAGCQTTP